MNKFGLTDNQLKFLEQIFLKHLGKNHFKVWLFGSRATGKNQKYSDVDLLIECSNLNTILLSRIRSDIEESHFPFKTDLVNCRNLAPEFAQGIEEEKKLLFDSQK